MTAEAISRVTSALQARLQAALVAADPGNPSPGNVFVGPFDDPQAQAAALSLFPYRIVPNPSLRNTGHRVRSPTSPPPSVFYANALPLDLYYLLSVGSRPGDSEEPLLRVLGFAIQALQAGPDLPGTTVTSAGMHVSLEPDVVHVTLEPLGTDEISRIWALFPTANYRTSVAYMVSPVWIDPPAPPVVAGPVLQDRLGSGQAAPIKPAGTAP